MITYKKVGALHFFRIGRFGGSLYLAKRMPVSSNPNVGNPERAFAIGFTASLALCAVIQTVAASI